MINFLRKYLKFNMFLKYLCIFVISEKKNFEFKLKKFNRESINKNVGAPANKCIFFNNCSYFIH